MADDPLAIDVSFAVRLVAARFPEWADLALTPFDSPGTDNTVFRIGESACLRLPRLASADTQLLKEAEWLDRLAPLPLAIPRPLALSGPFETFQYHATIYNWLPGTTALKAPPADLNAAAEALAEFLTALRGKPTDCAPAAGPQNQYRGAPLTLRDRLTRKAIAQLSDRIDVDRLSALWTACLDAPALAGAPMWLHGDLQAGNLIVQDSRLTGIIDFGLAGIGDPAADLIIAWSFLDTGSRETLRRALGAGEAEWRRGQGWALSTAVIALDYYRDTNPALSGLSLRALKALEAEA